MAREKSLEHETAATEERMAQAQAGELESQAREIKGVKVLAARVDGFDREQLRTLVDSLRNKWKSAVIVLAARRGFERLDRQRRHQGPDGESSRGEAGAGGRAGRRRKRRRAARYGGGGGKDPSPLTGALKRVYSSVEGML